MVEEAASLAPVSSRDLGGLLRFIPRVAANPRLALALINAQVRLRGARVPLTVQLRGRVRLSAAGEVTFGDGVSLIGDVVPLEFIAHKGGRLLVGDQTFINYGSSISAHELVSIGRNCLLGHYTFILDNNHHSIDDHYALPPSKPVILEDRVWLGSRVMILPGVHIGHDSVIGAGSVVTKDIPPLSVAMGNPAKVVRSITAKS